ncbi:hypothetical protein PPSIR1_04263 [Plesiocystis pacifica SIR-1]|uniref:VWFA domain-containing protein n=1 Tax=Plesiocystis pacifica SIR-1 TaxID=391625 RepID=A6GFD4_9BACT|nr:VWA domain-containing protein [Plesiocystis pacifica]EDM75419.1 hypothetical protein PPSIR1_04263 [Plesiocystis pacifica SIR-1]
MPVLSLERDPSTAPRRPLARWCAPLALGALLGLTLAPGEARADWLYGTRGEGAMTERSHVVELSFERGYATMTVTRAFHNGHDDFDEATLELALPEGAVATGLRTQSKLEGRTQWHAGQLLDADLAAQRYTELTGLGIHQPRDPALLAWDGLGRLFLQVFPIAPGSDKVVEYSLDMPASWVEGRWVLELETLGLDDVPAEVHVRSANRKDRLFVDGRSLRSGGAITLDVPRTISLAPRSSAGVFTELAVAPAGADRSIAHWRVGVPAQLSELPERARIVVGLDLSRSMDLPQIEAERQAALTTLSHFEDPKLGAKVAVLGFDHEVHALTPGLVSVAEAIEALERADLERGNGSDLGLALEAATTLLSAADRRAAKRVVMFSDFELRSRIQPADYEAVTAASGAIVHLATIEPASAGPYLDRDDAHPWTGLARATGGVVWFAGAGASPDDDDREAARRIFEELARPVRLDGLRVELDGVDYDSQLPESLFEGEGHAELSVSQQLVSKVRVGGWRWGAPVELVMHPDPALEQRWSALVFGNEALFELDDDEMRALATRGGAVSPVTSYLAIEPGVRPSTAGFAFDNVGLIGKGGCGGSGSGYGSAGGVPFGGRLDRQVWLEAQLGAVWLRCGGAGTRAQVQLEATFEEIVDLQFSPAQPVNAAVLDCVAERSWDLGLPADDFIEARKTWVVEVDVDA